MNPTPTPTPTPNPNPVPKKDPQLGQEKKQAGEQQMQGGEGQEYGEGQQYGEGNYKATRQYNEGLKEHVENHDIEREARDAAPRTAAEEEEMERAERIGRSKSRGEGATPDGNAADDDA